MRTKRTTLSTLKVTSSLAGLPTAAQTGARASNDFDPSPLVAPLAVLHAATADAELTIHPQPHDAVAAEATLKRLRPRLRALASETLAPIRIDVRNGALAAMRVHALVTQSSALHERFLLQHEADEVELATLADVRDAAAVVLLTYGLAEAAGAFDSEAKVPPELVKEAATVEGRMQELLEYRFKRDPEVAPLLALLRPGTGYRDLAADLLGYADIYRLKRAEIAVDGLNYRATDEAEARRLAGEILGHLSGAMSPKARNDYDTLQRAWTLLLGCYSEVREIGLYLLRYDPRRHEKFPSLVAAARTAQPRKKRDESPTHTPAAPVASVDA